MAFRKRELLKEVRGVMDELVDLDVEVEEVAWLPGGRMLLL